MDINGINKMCSEVSDKRNQMINRFAHTCGECSNFESIDGGICYKHQVGVEPWEECVQCDGEDFRRFF